MLKISLTLMFLFVFAAGNLSAQEKQPPPAEMDIDKLEAQGYVPLFNGENLDGWEKRGGTGEYKIEDDAIVGFGEDIKGNTFLCTEKTYGDFIMIFQMKFDDLSGNSGMMFRAYAKGGDGRVTGYQCEHDNRRNRGWTAGLFDEARRGWLYPNKADQEQCEAFSEQGKRLFKEDDWNTIVIRCKGLDVDTWLNGEHRVDFTDEAGKDYDDPGFFGLQVHSGKSCNIRWRNLYIKPLEAE